MKKINIIKIYDSSNSNDAKDLIGKKVLIGNCLITKEDLIRYIVCDGEPADESCVGHPVLAFDHAISAIHKHTTHKIISRGLISFIESTYVDNNESTETLCNHDQYK